MSVYTFCNFKSVALVLSEIVLKIVMLNWFGSQLSIIYEGKGSWKSYQVSQAFYCSKDFVFVFNLVEASFFLNFNIPMKRHLNNSPHYFYNRNFRSSRPEVFLGKDVLKICSKFTGEHPCRSVISIKLLSSFFQERLWVAASGIFGVSSHCVGPLLISSYLHCLEQSLPSSLLQVLLLIYIQVPCLVLCANLYPL